MILIASGMYDGSIIATAKVSRRVASGATH